MWEHICHQFLYLWYLLNVKQHFPTYIFCHLLKYNLGTIHKWRHTNLGGFSPPPPLPSRSYTLRLMYFCHTSTLGFQKMWTPYLCTEQWRSEYGTSTVFKLSKVVQSPIGLVFECHLNTRLNLVWYWDHLLNTGLVFKWSECQTTIWIPY